MNGTLEVWKQRAKDAEADVEVRKCAMRAIEAERDQAMADFDELKAGYERLKAALERIAALGKLTRKSPLIAREALKGEGE